MAFYQIAYTFAAERFHADLEAKVVKGGVFDFTELQRLARAIMANPSDEVVELAHFFGYEDDWIDDPDGDYSHYGRWYTINIWSTLKLCPSLSNNRMYLSHFAIEKALLVAGWLEEDIYALMMGKRIGNVFELDDNSVFAQTLRQCFVFGGCLTIHENQRLLSQLSAYESFFLTPNITFAAPIKASLGIDRSVSELLALAYWDARDMLETALSRNETLYLSWA